MSPQLQTTIQKPKAAENPAPTYRALRRTTACDGVSGIDVQRAEGYDDDLSMRNLKFYTTPGTQQDHSAINTSAPSSIQRSEPGAGKPHHNIADMNVESKARTGHDLSRVHIQATSMHVIQAKLAVNQPGDQYEQEAEEVAERAMRMITPDIALAPSPPNENPPGSNSLLRSIGKSLSTLQAHPVPASVNEAVSGPGHPLDAITRASMEQRLGYDLSLVRIHTNEQDAQSAQSVNALAYTIGRDIVFAQGQYAPDTEVGRRLLAHELTHVVQQRAIPALPIPVYGSLSTRTAALVNLSPVRPAPEDTQVMAQPTIQRFTTGLQVQRQEQTNAGQPVQQEKSWWEEVTDFSETMIWRLIREFAPELEPILQNGILAWLEEKIKPTIESAVNTLMAPVRVAPGVIQSLSTHFSELLIWMQDAGTKLAKGDCSAISEAVEKIQHVIDGLASPVIERAKEPFQRVGTFFTDVWNQFGAPVWEWLKKVGGQAWEKIQQFGNWLWVKTEPIRNKVERAWTWIKNRLGIGEGPEGQNGLLQWVETKASTVWESIKKRIEPIKKPLMVVAGVLAALSPAGPLLLLGKEVAALISGIRWIRQNLNKPNSITSNREMLQKIILPGIINGIKSFTRKLTGVAGSISEKLAQVVSGLGQLIGVVSTSILSFAVSAIEWIADKFQILVTWATDKLGALVDWVARGLEHLQHFLQPVFDLLAKVGAVVVDILQLPALLVGKLWHMIPACIRNPITNFLIEHILKKVPIFNKLLAIPNIWERLKGRAMEIIHKIFSDGDLTGAVIAVFKLMLEVLSVPIELVTSIFTKAATALDLIVKDPLAFLKNVLGAIKLGFTNFFKNIATHLLAGVADWLFDELLEHGIHRPADLNFISIFKFVLEILGVTTETIFKKIEEKTSPEFVRKIRSATKAIGQAWDWVTDLVKEGPAALWHRLTSQIGNLWNIFLGGIINWVEKNIIQAIAQQLLSFLDPTGIMEIVQGLLDIYRAIKSVVKYLDKMVRILNTILDTLIGIASGVLGPAAQMLEDTMHRAMPVVIGFLAGEVGMDDIGDRIKEIVEGVRERVDAALDWLVNRAVKGGQAVLGALGLVSKEENRPEDQNKPTDVKELAANLLSRKLQDSDGYTKTQVQEIVDQVFTQLQSQGLKSLKIGSESADGSYVILAEASPIDPILLMQIARADAQVKMVATVTFSSTQALRTSRAFRETNMPNVKAANAADTASVVHPGTSLPQTEQEAKEGKERVNSNVFQVISWNTGNPDTTLDSNSSHAETQFMSWFNKDISSKSLLALEKIELYISESPCSFCADDLCKFMRNDILIDEGERSSLEELAKAGKLQVILKYVKPHSTGKHPTTIEDIKDLEGCKIKVQALGKAVTKTRAEVEANPRYATAISPTGQYSRSSARKR